MLAAEYYDRSRHPTCHAFRIASRAIIAELLEDQRLSGIAVELGAGQAIFPECVPAWRKLFDRVFIVDSSASMLAHSTAMARAGANLLEEDARAISVEDSSVDTLISSLGDPYNDGELWAEIRRILAPDGLAIFTTPSWEWASRFRDGKQMDTADSAEFLMADGQLVSVPSFVLAEEQQSRMIESAGLSVEKILSRCSAQVAEARVAPKLGVISAEEPIVIGYRVRRA